MYVTSALFSYLSHQAYIEGILKYCLVKDNYFLSLKHRFKHQKKNYISLHKLLPDKFVCVDAIHHSQQFFSHD